MVKCNTLAIINLEQMFYMCCNANLICVRIEQMFELNLNKYYRFRYANTMEPRTILHCDCNNFYASVEICKNPELKGKPIAVCGNAEKRHGIVLAKSYPAKDLGVKTGDVIWEAKKKCPNLIVLGADYKAYMKYSEAVFEIFTRFTDRVEPFGLDECWLDVTASIKLLGSGEVIADTLREIVNSELGLTISVGVSFTKIFAKLGSDLKKPDATTIITRKNFRTKIWNLDVGDLLMVGRRTKVTLNKCNIYTIGDLAKADLKFIKAKLGIVGIQLVQSANGIENSEVHYYYERPIPKSIGHGTTTPRDIKCIEELRSVVYSLSDQVAKRLRLNNFLAKGVSLSARTNELESKGRQAHFLEPTNSGKDIAKAALDLFEREFDLTVPLRKVQVSAFALVLIEDDMQYSFFDEEIKAGRLLDTCIDSLNIRYGHNTVKRGIIMLNNDMADIFSDIDFTPFKR